jgi:hypothetical protein
MTLHAQSTYLQTIQQIEEERVAAMRGLLGPAVVASHACIEARITQGANHILDLIKRERVSEAMLLMEQSDWGEQDSIVYTAGQNGNKQEC